MFEILCLVSYLITTLKRSNTKFNQVYIPIVDRLKRFTYAELKKRRLVYEYMEHGSLEDNLRTNNILDWQKRFEIAVGTAKGLAYLHEECLEWVLHCDVKPQNVLLTPIMNQR